MFFEIITSDHSTTTTHICPPLATHKCTFFPRATTNEKKMCYLTIFHCPTCDFAMRKRHTLKCAYLKALEARSDSEEEKRRHLSKESSLLKGNERKPCDKCAEKEKKERDKEEMAFLRSQRGESLQRRVEHRDDVRVLWSA